MVGTLATQIFREVMLSVPREMESVKVETQCGNIEVKDIAGNFDGESGGGTVIVDTIGGTVTAETGGGDVRITRASGAHIVTGGGNIDLGDIGVRSRSKRAAVMCVWPARQAP